MVDQYYQEVTKGKDVTIVDVFEGIGKHSTGAMTKEDLFELETLACPSGGSCGGQFTANTMACVSEAYRFSITRFCWHTQRFMRSVINFLFLAEKL